VERAGEVDVELGGVQVTEKSAAGDEDVEDIKEAAERRGSAQGAGLQVSDASGKRKGVGLPVLATALRTCGAERSRLLLEHVGVAPALDTLRSRTTILTETRRCSASVQEYGRAMVRNSERRRLCRTGSM
jgi:hypothetical protein